MVDLAAGFVVDPEAARAAAVACRSQAEFLDRILYETNLRSPDDYGDCWIGQTLTTKFARKNGQGDTGLVRPLVRASRDLYRLAADFEAMAEAYRRTDRDAVRLLDSAGEAC